MPELTESTISAIFGGLLLFGILIAWPAFTTALALMRSERMLGKLYWQFVVAVDTTRGTREASSEKATAKPRNSRLRG
jgi:hypothetical protein